MSEVSLKTSLHSWHQQQGGKLVDFAGYALPLSYTGGGVLAEHQHTREAASLFDVSHMGQVQIPYSDSARSALAQLFPVALDTLTAGHARYTFLTTAQGGIIDDCIITADGDAGWFIVLNASRKAVDLQHIRSTFTAAGADATAIKEYNECALIAIQGPAAAKLISAIFPAAADLLFMQSVCVDSPFGRCRISRCGYTGEDGFEISIANDAATTFAQQLIANPLCKPAGLGARDSLRLEAGLCLYGNELNENTSPVEARLVWAIPKALRRADACYFGAAPIAEQINNGAARRLVALLPQSKTPVRQGGELYYQGTAVGQVTSGVYSPTLSVPIALGMIATSVAADAELNVNVRGRDIACQQTTLPFVPHRYYRG